MFLKLKDEVTTEQLAELGYIEKSDRWLKKHPDNHFKDVAIMKVHRRITWGNNRAQTLNPKWNFDDFITDLYAKNYVEVIHDKKW